ncbi:oxygenase MpaB family protein [Archangium lansingense]|uniref:Oxygenase MpaB family protein n=1 Tax=Archangium lansingense TaxID=2995310 RepID=A0ABT4A828_9BACT|nr:oxygenase MpaB family protein [Archangium lansinium]MCY1077821.1 oxygenase MpaB family protein [Archangium lansinium]
MFNANSEWLDRMRSVGDPGVDALIAEHVATRGPESLELLLRDLFRTQRMPEADPLVRSYLEVLPRIELVDREVIARGQDLFGLYGPEVLMILGSYSLPLAYAAGHGVQVVYRSRRLKDEPIRRLCDTAQMVVNVMQPGELEEGGVGWLAARKVRLIHALVRRRVQLDAAHPWRAEWGLPINQEDQAGTLLSFSIATLQGLRRMGARVTSEEADAYITAWSAVGRLLGVDPSLLPPSEKEAALLALRIGARQVRPTPEGRQLTAQLLNSVQTLFPVAGYATSLTHFFLQDTVFGKNVAEALDLPKANWTRWFVMVRAAEKRTILSLLDWVPGARRRRSWVARQFAQRMILHKRPDGGSPFEVPPAFRGRWGLHMDR